MPADRKLIVALDTIDATLARRWADAVVGSVGLFKLGLEFFLANGPSGVAGMTGAPIFLDLKLHDIPNTVAGGIRAILPLQPKMVTVHAAGGGAMIQAAHQAALNAGPARPMILAVTVLTSLQQSDLSMTGVSGTPAEQVLRLARLAIEAQADGLVCSPLEVAMLREALGPAVRLVVPGIRPAGIGPTGIGPTGHGKDDQARTMTPAQAVAAGADWIVVGRPITAAPDPGAAAASIAAAIQ